MNKEKSIIYKFKIDTDFNELAKLGWDIIPSEIDLIFFKTVPQPIDGDLYRYLLINFYKNEEWKDKFYKKNEKEITKNVGVKYDKNGILKMTPKLEMNLRMWRLETNRNDDFWLGLKSADPYDNNYFYSKKLIDKYCEEEVKKLKELGLIEEIEVEQ
jgi:hypothetical protein